MATDEENLKNCREYLLNTLNTTLYTKPAEEPAERAQRKLVVALMPELYMLRNKGYSWRQLSKMLGDCNIRLLPTTIRVYYTEMLESKMDECQRRFNEYLVVLSEMKKVVGQTSLVDRAAGIIEQQRLRTERITNERIKCLQGADGQGGMPGKRPAIEHELAQVQSGAQRAPEPDPTPSSEYGLTVAATAPAVSKPGKPAFMGGDDAPGVPVLDGDDSPAPPTAGGEKTKNSAAPSARGKDLRCLTLQNGIKTLPKRAGINTLVYDSDDLMEHPAIDSLMLSKAERLYGAYLEYADADGVVQIETIIQKNQRIKWERPFKNKPSSTENDFVKMDMSLFPGKH